MVSGLTYFHLLVKFFSLLFPRFNDTRRQMCPSGNILVGDAALTKVYQEIAKVGVLDYVDRLNDPVNDMKEMESKDKPGHHRRRTSGAAS